MITLPDGRIVSGATDECVKIWNFNGECLHELRASLLDFVLNLPIDNLFIIGNFMGPLSIFDPDTYTYRCIIKAKQKSIKRVFTL